MSPNKKRCSGFFYSGSISLRGLYNDNVLMIRGVLSLPRREPSLKSGCVRIHGSSRYRLEAACKERDEEYESHTDDKCRDR